MRILFWNTNGMTNHELVGQLVHQEDPDIVVLAEPGIPIAELLVILNDRPGPLFFSDASVGLSNRLQLLFRLPAEGVHAVRDEFDLAVRHVSPPLSSSFTLIAAHFPSKLHQDSDDQVLSLPRVARIVEEAETQLGHHRTILVGDFNMNPFEAGIAGAGGLHAVMDDRIAMRRQRTIRGESFRFFYNPMWSRFGDDSVGPSGSYFYDASGEEINFYWNTFDQVLLSADLLPNFSGDDLEVVTEVGPTALLDDRGMLNRAVGSDHLPIVFKLDL